MGLYSVNTDGNGLVFSIASINSRHVMVQLLFSFIGCVKASVSDFRKYVEHLDEDQSVESDSHDFDDRAVLASSFTKSAKQ